MNGLFGTISQMLFPPSEENLRERELVLNDLKRKYTDALNDEDNSAVFIFPEKPVQTVFYIIVDREEWSKTAGKYRPKDKDIQLYSDFPIDTLIKTFFPVEVTMAHIELSRNMKMCSVEHTQLSNGNKFSVDADGSRKYIVNTTHLVVAVFLHDLALQNHVSTDDDDDDNKTSVLRLKNKELEDGLRVWLRRPIDKMRDRWTEIEILMPRCIPMDDALMLYPRVMLENEDDIIARIRKTAHGIDPAEKFAKISF
jgi:hypothetical protein